MPKLNLVETQNLPKSKIRFRVKDPKFGFELGLRISNFRFLQKFEIWQKIKIPPRWFTVTLWSNQDFKIKFRFFFFEFLKKQLPAASSPGRRQRPPHCCADQALTNICLKSKLRKFVEIWWKNVFISENCTRPGPNFAWWSGWTRWPPPNLKNQIFPKFSNICKFHFHTFLGKFGGKVYRPVRIGMPRANFARPKKYFV